MKRFSKMSEQPVYKSLESYRRKQRYGPFIMGAIAIVLAALGLVFLFLWWKGSPMGTRVFATDTPTATSTATSAPPTLTSTITLTPTITETSTPAPSPTAAAPFLYKVEEGDTITSIALKFGLDELEGTLTIMALNGLTYDDYLIVGQDLIIPDPNTGLPTATPLPDYIPQGTLIEYMVLPGDTLAIIANKFLSTEDGIIEENDLENPNQIFVGQVLLVPARLVTATPTPRETNTLEGGESIDSIEVATATTTP
jgi:spore germination protein